MRSPPPEKRRSRAGTRDRQRRCANTLECHGSCWEAAETDVLRLVSCAKVLEAAASGNPDWRSEAALSELAYGLPTVTFRLMAPVEHGGHAA